MALTWPAAGAVRERSLKSIFLETEMSLVIRTLPVVCRKPRRGLRGVSLIEVMVAMAFLSFGLYGASELVIASRRTGWIASNRTQATGLAQLKLEELRMMAASMPWQPDPLGGFLPQKLNTEAPVPFSQNPKFSWQATMVRPPSDMNRVEIEVVVTRTADHKKADTPLIAQGSTFLAAWPAGREALQ